MVHQRLQEEAFVWAGSHLGLRFQSSGRKSVEGGRPKRTHGRHSLESLTRSTSTFE